MLTVKLKGSDFSDDGFVILANVPRAIARTKGGGNIHKTERDIAARIVSAIRCGQLVPHHPNGLLPLSEDEYGIGIVPFEQLRVWGHATMLFDFVSVAPAAMEQASPDTANRKTSKANDEPPAVTKGLVTISRLAIKAAWEIECEKKRKASATEVIKRLQEWVTANQYEELIAVIPHGVKWMTTAPDEKRYDIGACSATLRSWHKRRTMSRA
jgi:hypothetical protein